MFLACVVAFSGGVGGGYVMTLGYQPALIVETKWRDIEPNAVCPPYVPHTPMSQEELRYLYTLTLDPGLNASATPTTTTTLKSSTLPPSSPPSTRPTTPPTLFPPTTATTTPPTTVPTTTVTTVPVDTTTTSTPPTTTVDTQPPA